MNKITTATSGKLNKAVYIYGMFMLIFCVQVSPFDWTIIHYWLD
jgi:hypothetical protein